MKTEKGVSSWAKANRGKRAELSVGGVPGLCARLAADGKLTYALRYRTRGSGVQRTLTIGAVTLGAAREEADKLRAQALVATDPWEERLAERLAEQERKRATGRTLTSVAEAWLGSESEPTVACSKEAAEWRPGTRRETRRLLRKHFLSVFGDCDPNRITRGEVRKLLDDLAERAPSEAIHAHAALRGLYNWLRADRQEHYGITQHPLLGLEMAARPPRERTYSDDELRRIVAAVEGTGLEDLVGILLHTGTRDRETRAMRWADVDLDRRVWTIPADVSKNKRAHVVALSAAARAILKRRPVGEFVFPNPDTRTGYIERDQKALRAAAIAAGLLRNVGTEEKPEWEGEGLRLHDIRRTIGDRLKLEHGEAVMHGVLGHADAVLTKTYGPTPRLKVLADAVEWWAGEVERLLAVKAKEKLA